MEPITRGPRARARGERRDRDLRRGTPQHHDQVSKTPQMYLESAASTMATLGGNGLYRSGLPSEQMLVITSKARSGSPSTGGPSSTLQRFLFETAASPYEAPRSRRLGQIPTSGFRGYHGRWCHGSIVSPPGGHPRAGRGRPQRHMNAILTAGYSCASLAPLP